MLLFCSPRQVSSFSSLSQDGSVGFGSCGEQERQKDEEWVRGRGRRGRELRDVSWVKEAEVHGVVCGSPTDILTVIKRDSLSLCCSL